MRGSLCVGDCIPPPCAPHCLFAAGGGGRRRAATARRDTGGILGAAAWRLPSLCNRGESKGNNTRTRAHAHRRTGRAPSTRRRGGESFALSNNTHFWRTQKRHARETKQKARQRKEEEEAMSTRRVCALPLPLPLRRQPPPPPHLARRPAPLALSSGRCCRGRIFASAARQCLLCVLCVCVFCCV